MAEPQSILDALLESLAKSQESTSSGDSIDEVLGDAPRTTHVKSIRDDPIVAEFRQELAAGKIRAHTANRMLELLGRALNLL